MPSSSALSGLSPVVNHRSLWRLPPLPTSFHESTRYPASPSTRRGSLISTPALTGQSVLTQLAPVSSSAATRPRASGRRHPLGLTKRRHRLEPRLSAPLRLPLSSPPLEAVLGWWCSTQRQATGCRVGHSPRKRPALWEWGQARWGSSSLSLPATQPRCSRSPLQLARSNRHSHCPPLMAPQPRPTPGQDRCLSRVRRHP